MSVLHLPAATLTRPVRRIVVVGVVAVAICFFAIRSIFLTVAAEIHTRQFNCDLNLRGNWFATAAPASLSAHLPAPACLTPQPLPTQPLPTLPILPLACPSLTIMTNSG